MASYLLGVLLFALGIAVTIALHELGHMLTARAFGMRVRRYFIGFGPRLWSITKGHTEYGVAAVPFGGFCEIAGMTSNDEVTAEEAPHAMVNKPWWQRIAVLSGGVAMNILLGLGIIYTVAVAEGIPNPYADHTATVGEVTCTADQDPDTGELQDCRGVGAGGRAGIEVGDRIVAVDGQEIENFSELAATVSELPGETVGFTVQRGETLQDVEVTVDEVTRYTASGEPLTAGAVGLVNEPVAEPIKQFGPGEAMGATFKLTGQMLEATVEGVLGIPAKVPGLVMAIFGGERAEDSPMSVVGASMVGGELAERSLWNMFFMMLASLNLFLALFNLVPLPPLDGGHIAVVLYEKIRDFFRRLRGKGPGPAVNYEKLLPVTYVAAAALITLGGLVLVADVVNPIRLFG